MYSHSLKYRELWVIFCSQYLVLLRNMYQDSEGNKIICVLNVVNAFLSCVIKFYFQTET